MFKSEMSLSSRENIIEIRCNPGHVRMYKLKMTASEPDQEVSPRHINRWWHVIINSVSELSWLMDEGNDNWKISYDRNYRLFWPIFESKNSTLILNHHINEDNHHVLCIFSRYRMSSMPHKTHSWRGNCLFILLQVVSINVEHMLRRVQIVHSFQILLPATETAHPSDLELLMTSHEPSTWKDFYHLQELFESDEILKMNLSEIKTWIGTKTHQSHKIVNLPHPQSRNHPGDKREMMNNLACLPISWSIRVR